MKKSCVLVSGGAGYIGSHTAVELISAGYDVVIVDNLSNSDIDAVEGVRRITGVDVPFEKADCCDRDAFARVFEKYDFDSVIHFAASKAVGESVSKPLEYYRNNLMSFMNVIGLMREYGRQNIVFSSSCTVYGEADVLPVTEQTPRKPATSPYGNTKQMCEDILRDSLAAYEGLKGIALRYFNPIGAHPSALIGELPRGVPRTWCLTSRRLPQVSANACRCSGTTTRRPTARTSALYRRGRPGEGACGGDPAHDRGQEQGPVRGIQHRHGARGFGAGAGAPVRAGQPPQTQL